VCKKRQGRSLLLHGKQWHNIYLLLSTSKSTTMENTTETIILLKALDMELMAIIAADLEAFKNSRQDIAA
jgi:hypothetical protein